MSLPAIEVSGLSKHYVIQHESRHDNLRDTLHHTARKLWRRYRWGTGFETEEFWALRDVSFSVQPGEVVGIIGRNGAGKSTLLKILSRITEPTAGTIRLRGRVASLLEVGTGFHPDLTGRENIFLNGAILGMSRAEIARKFDEIVAFAEIERFLDTPVKRYSSGMYVRLAFAVAAHLEPEILIVDEVLAVGDAAFQKKCLGKIRDVARDTGRTVLFVSHNMAAVSQLTTRAVLLERGQASFIGHTDEVVKRYLATAELHELPGVYDTCETPRVHPVTGEVAFERLWFDDPVPLFAHGRPIEFRFLARARQEVTKTRVSLTVFTHEGAPIGSGFSAPELAFRPGASVPCRVSIPITNLAPGRYHLGLALGHGDHTTGHVDFDVVMDVLRFEVAAPTTAQNGAMTTWPRSWGSLIISGIKADQSH